MLFNPYIAGNPIDDPTGFFGREEIFHEVEAVLAHPRRNAIVLYGQRRIGKTSILLQLKNRLTLSGQHTAVYLDLMDKGSKSLQDFLYEISLRISGAVNMPLPEPGTFDVEGRYFKDQFLPQAALRAANGNLVLLFDEFDVLDSPERNQAGTTFFPYLRQWLNQVKQVQFVFVIGRRPEDLSVDTMSTFKGVKATHVGLLTRSSTEALIRSAEEMSGLLWSRDAIDAVWKWTRGHPYFTQLLCEITWDGIYRQQPGARPTALMQDVENAIDGAMSAGANAFVWLWDGLPPTEKVVMSAIAESPDPVISQNELINILHKSGVRLIVRQLELAPDVLEEWGLLEKVADGYQFTVPLLRLWVNKFRPLRRVKEELDQLEPMAERLYQTGFDFYGMGNHADAFGQLERALSINPHHLKAKLLLGRVLCELGQPQEALDVLEEAYKYDASAARNGLVVALQMLIRQYDEADDIVAEFETHQRLLEVAPDNKSSRDRIVILENTINEIMRQREAAANSLAAAQNWAEVKKIYQDLIKQFGPADKNWQTSIEQAEEEILVQHLLQEAIIASKSRNYDSARQDLLRILNLQPTNMKASELLDDVNTIQKSLRMRLNRVVSRLNSFSFRLGSSDIEVTGLTLVVSAFIITILTILLLQLPFGSLPANATLPGSLDFFRHPQAVAPPPPSATGEYWQRSIDNMIMVAVRGGSFTMGSDEAIDLNAASDEKPTHSISLDSYWLDQFEVTNQQYAAFMQTAIQAYGFFNSDWLPENGSVHLQVSGNQVQIASTFENHPVTGVTWSGARAYCIYVGADLPTEAQWEYAARGSDQRIYPWGNENPTCRLAQFSSCGGETAPVESYADGQSWLGAHNLAGNVWEWVLDSYSSTFYAKSSVDNPLNEDGRNYKVMRGGSWANDWRELRAANRNGLLAETSLPTLGFRCASSIPEP